jgi:hypothetical protein
MTLSAGILFLEHSKREKIGASTIVAMSTLFLVILFQYLMWLVHYLSYMHFAFCANGRGKGRLEAILCDLCILKTRCINKDRGGVPIERN